MSRFKTAGRQLKRYVVDHWVGVCLCSICLTAFFVYSPLLFGSFLHFDDGQQIFENLRIKELNWRNFADALFTNYTGKGSAPSFALSVLNWAVTPNYAGFAAVNLIFFMGFILLFYRFTALFLGDPKWRLISTLIFSVHSLNTDALGWMSARCHIMGAAFILFCFVFWQKYQDDISPSKRFLWYLLAVLSAAVAVWNKGIFLVIPGLIFAYDVYRRRRIRPLFFLDKIPLAVIAYLPLLYAPLKMGANHLANPGIGSSLYITILNDAGLILQYFFHLLIPGPTAVSIDVYPVKSLFDVSDASSLVCMRLPPIFNFAVIALLFAALLFFFVRYKAKNGVFFFVIILMALSPVMNIPPRWVDFAFRFEQMPLFFFCVGVGSVGRFIRPRVSHRGHIVMIAAFSALILGHAVMSFTQARNWNTEIKYWIACTENYPDSIVCRYKSVWLLNSAGQVEEATKHSLEVHQYSMYRPPNRRRPTAKHLAGQYQRMGRKKDALFYYRQSLLVDPLNREERKSVRDEIRTLEKELPNTD